MMFMLEPIGTVWYPVMIAFNHFWRVFQSVAASMFGVQSEKNRQLDFQTTSFLPYVVVGVLFVIGFIVAIMLVVQFILV